MYRRWEMKAVPAQQPQLRENLGLQAPSVENANNRALGYNNRDSACFSRNRSCGEMAASEAECHIDTFGGRIEIPARCSHYASLVEDKRPIKLRQFLDGTSEIRICDPASLRGMQRQRVENEWPRMAHYGIHETNCEKRTDAASFAGDFDRQF